MDFSFHFSDRVASNPTKKKKKKKNQKQLDDVCLYKIIISFSFPFSRLCANKILARHLTRNALLSY